MGPPGAADFLELELRSTQTTKPTEGVKPCSLPFEPGKYSWRWLSCSSWQAKAPARTRSLSPQARLTAHPLSRMRPTAGRLLLLALCPCRGTGNHRRYLSPRAAAAQPRSGNLRARTGLSLPQRRSLLPPESLQSCAHGPSLSTHKKWPSVNDALSTQLHCGRSRYDCSLQSELARRASPPLFHFADERL